MLKINKNKGISLIELMVAVSLGLILIFSMLAFYGVSQNNLAAYIRENEAKRDIRRIMSLISKDVENTALSVQSPRISLKIVLNLNAFQKILSL